MRRLSGSLAIVALLIALLAGCGSSGGSDAIRAQISNEIARHEHEGEAHLKLAEAEERAAGLDPRKIESREVAYRKRKERDERAEKVREGQETAAQERRTEAQREASERAEREEEESKPGSHHYPPAVRRAFVESCEQTSGHQDSTCKCAIKRIEAKIPLGQYQQHSAEVGDGRRSLPLIYSIEVGYCIGEEAVAAG